MPDLFIGAAIVLIAGVVQGVAGFGFGMTAMGLLPLVVDVPFAVPFVAVYSVIVAGLLAWQLRASIERAKVAPLLAGTFLGIPLGVAFLKQADPQLVKGVLGGVLIAYSVHGLSAGIRIRDRLHVGWGVAAGMAGGLLGGAFNASGPPVVAWVSLQGWSPDAIKATLQVFFVLTALLAVAGFVVTGLVTPATLRWNALLLPALLVGVLLGSRIYARINPHVFRRLLLLGLLAMGCVYTVSVLA